MCVTHFLLDHVNREAGGMSTEVRIEDESDFKSAVADVRSDTSGTNW